MLEPCYISNPNYTLHQNHLPFFKHNEHFFFFGLPLPLPDIYLHLYICVYDFLETSCLEINNNNKGEQYQVRKATLL